MLLRKSFSSKKRQHKIGQGMKFFKSQNIQFLWVVVQLKKEDNLQTTSNKFLNSLGPTFQVKPQILQIPSSLIKIYLYNASLAMQKLQIHIKCQESIFIKFIIKDILQVELPAKSSHSSTHKIKWGTSGVFAMKGIYHEIGRKFLQVLVFNRMNPFEAIETIKINVYHIITGPYRNDFKVKINNKPLRYGRLSFNLKMVQILDIEFESLSNIIKLNDEYYGQKFNFTIQSLVNQSKVSSFLNSDSISSFRNDESYMSQHSYNIEVPFIKGNSYREITDEQIGTSQLKLSKKISNLMAVNENTVISWSKENSQKMPKFTLKIKVTDCGVAMLGIKLWRQNPLDKAKKFIQCGQVLFPITQIIQSNHITQKSINHPSLQQNQSISDGRDQQTYSSFTGQLKENNKVIGICTIQFKLKSTLRAEQQTQLTRTQDGITVDMFHKEVYQFNNKILSASFEEVSNAFKQLNNAISQFNDPQSKKTRLYKYSKLKEVLNKVSIVLEETNKEQMDRFQESRGAQLLHRQQIFLSYAGLLKDLIESDDSLVVEYAWKTIIQLFKRICLMLKNIGFNKNERVMFDKHISDGLIERKIQIGIKYQNVVYELLEKSLETYQLEGQNDYCAKFRAYCYFSVPIFRQIFLKSISSNLNQCNYQNIQTNLFTSKSFTKIKSSQQITEQEIILMVLDYKKYFYQFLQNDPRSRTLNQELQEKLKCNKWMIDISKLSRPYFKFIKVMISELQYQFKAYIKPHLVYKYLPGIQKITDTIICQMGKTELKKYQKSGIVEATSLMLQNQDLIHIFLPVIYQKTDLNNNQDVWKLLQILQTYLKILTQKSKLKRNFPASYFFKGIKLILQKQHNRLTCKVLFLLYCFFEKFSDNLTLILLKYFLGSSFDKMFYHWCCQTRMIFHLFLIKKISQSQLLDSKTHHLGKKLNDRMKLIEAREEQVAKRNMKNIVRNRKVRNQNQLFLRMKQKLHNKKYRKILDQKAENTQNLQIKRRNLSDGNVKFPNDEILKPVTVVNLRKLSFGNELYNNDIIFKLHKKPSFNFQSIKLIDKTQPQEDQLIEQPKFNYYHQSFSDEQISSNINPNIIPYVLVATREFKEQNQKISRYVSIHNCIPKDDFQSLFTVSIDKKQVKPTDTLYH